MAPRSIQTTLGVITIKDKKGRAIRQESYIRSSPLLASLHTIRDASTEAHTRNNIQALIDQIGHVDPTL